LEELFLAIKRGNKMKIKIGMIGGGNMGGAIISGICKEYNVSVCEQDPKRRQSLKRKYKIATGDLEAVVKKSDLIILAVKPQSFDSILKELKPHLDEDQLVISIAAGITCRYIEKRLREKTRVVRAMPNLPAQVNEGITAVCSGKAAMKKDLILAQLLFSCVGVTAVVEEKYMDGITAASGSGPAYVFLFIESLKKAVRSLGFEEKVANALVIQTIKGSMTLLSEQKEDAGVLRARVTSKGGTTQAAMDVFKKSNFEKVFKTALSAAKKRAKELSK
jgi:pyrroline-5-carboxylate reductase